MYADPEELETDTTASTVVCRISRSSEDQIDLVVAYLLERK